MKARFWFLVVLIFAVNSYGQRPYTASFVAKLGRDTVIVETYGMVANHLYGKAFLRYPEDQIGVFDFHFYPDGSIRHYSISMMKPDSSYVPLSGTQGLFCENDSCTWFASWDAAETEYVNTRPARQMDFVGGWTPTLALIEWNCMRLMKSGKPSLPLTMINDYVGIRHISISRGNRDTLLFGGPFLEYTKLKVTEEGRITQYDGTGTPWNYIATKHPPIDVDEVAKRLSRTPKIGIPSPEVKVSFPIRNDTIRLSYGRPSRRGRVIFGGIVPFDSVWRTGAGDPTQITLPFDIRIGKTTIPKGSYTLYTIPRPDEWTLIFNTDLKQWPTDPNRTKDFAYIPLKLKRPDQAYETFTISIEEQKGRGIMRFIWDETEAYVLFEVLKDR